jgi:hypothetical protein
MKNLELIKWQEIYSIGFYMIGDGGNRKWVELFSTPKRHEILEMLHFINGGTNTDSMP